MIIYLRRKVGLSAQFVCTYFFPFHYLPWLRGCCLIRRVNPSSLINISFSHSSQTYQKKEEEDKMSESPILGTRLQNKVAIVTGGGSGFGAGIARRFAEEGCKVIIADIDAVGGERVASAWPQSMAFVKMDVTREEEWEGLCRKVVERWGRIDVCVNNAGGSYRNKVCMWGGQEEGELEMEGWRDEYVEFEKLTLCFGNLANVGCHRR